jgi:glycosyltransferase involved in cell wall biosynthesis
MVPTKGHHVLLEAISKARSQLPPFELNIAGDGPCRREIEEKVSALGLDNVVRTRGSLSDMPAFYRGMDVVVQPSLSEEGLPLAILEALATGVPVIASDVAGAREVITPGVNGFLFRPGDPDGLAQHLIRFVTLSAQSRGSMSWSATARIRASCSREVVADAVLRRYDSLLEAE